jgi:AraC-like DNA-binding protein
MEIIDFGLKETDFYAVGLKGTLEDFSSHTLHVHPFHQVLQIRNGVALLQDRRSTRPQYGRMAAFIPAYLPHRTQVVGDAVEYQSLYFRRSLLKAPSGSITVFRMSGLGLSLLHHLNSGESLQNLDRGILRDCVRLFMKTLSSDLPDKTESVILPEAKDELSREICRFIEGNYQRRLTSGDFTMALPLSFRQLSRRFKADMGLNIFEYLRVFRMLKASIYLNTTGMKIIAVAYECGYDSLSSFFTDFRKVFGLSPAEFRAHHK